MNDYLCVIPPSLPLKDICISGGFALALFAGAISLAAYAGQWSEFERPSTNLSLSASIRSATGGSAVSAETNTSLKSLATWSPSPW